MNPDELAKLDSYLRQWTSRNSGWQDRSPEEIASFFEGLELVEPGVVSCTRWRPDPSPSGPPAEVDAFGGVGRKT